MQAITTITVFRSIRALLQALKRGEKLEHSSQNRCFFHIWNPTDSTWNTRVKSESERVILQLEQVIQKGVIEGWGYLQSSGLLRPAQLFHDLEIMNLFLKKINLESIPAPELDEEFLNMWLYIEAVLAKRGVKLLFNGHG